VVGVRPGRYNEGMKNTPANSKHPEETTGAASLAGVLVPVDRQASPHKGLAVLHSTPSREDISTGTRETSVGHRPALPGYEAFDLEKTFDKRGRETIVARDGAIGVVRDDPFKERPYEHLRPVSPVPDAIRLVIPSEADDSQVSTLPGVSQPGPEVPEVQQLPGGLFGPVVGAREKRCSKCGIVRDKKLFAADKRNRDRLHSWCRICQAANARAWLRKQGKAYTRYNYQQHREYFLRKFREWRQAHPKAGMARSIVRRAIRTGDLTPLPCEHCGKSKSIAHHEDYSRPLDVVWLCRSCHRYLHQARRL